MRLGEQTNGISCEYEMQERMCEWLEAKELKYRDEVRVQEVGRIADFLVVKANKLINIEAKCNDYACMMKQLCDHSDYCDYSFAFITNYSMTPKDFKEKLAKRGYGLIVWDNETKTITEVLESHHNKPQRKDLKTKYYEYVSLAINSISSKPKTGF